MKLSEICAILKGFIADDDSVTNYSIGHAGFGAYLQSSIDVDERKKRIVLDDDGYGSDSVACLLEYEEQYADYDVFYMELGFLKESEGVEISDKKKAIMII
jgi:hypothetical protein